MMLKKKMTLGASLLISLSLVLSACGAKDSTAGGTADEVGKKVTIRLASAFDQSTPMLQAGQKFAEIVKEQSKGNIEVQLFPGGTMGSEKDNLESLKIGELEMGIFGTFPIANLTPKYSFFDAPFVFRDKDHFYKVWDSKLGQSVRDTFKSNHVHTLSLMDRGYRHITSNKPINSVEDMQGLKIRMGQSKPFIDSFTGLGAVVSPIALPELFTSLKMGVVEASDGPFDQIYSFKLYEAQKHLALTGHAYGVSMWLMNEEIYNSLTDKQKAIIDDATNKAIQYGNELANKSEVDLLEKLKSEGMQVTKPDLKPFMDKAKPAIDKLFKETWDVTTAEEISNIK